MMTLESSSLCIQDSRHPRLPVASSYLQMLGRFFRRCLGDSFGDAWEILFEILWRFFGRSFGDSLEIL